MELSEIRKGLDEIDKELVTLFERRMELSGLVADYKVEHNKPVRDMERESEKLEAVKALTHNDFNAQGASELFTQIMSISRKLQYQKLTEKGIFDRLPFTCVEQLDTHRAKIVYQGVEGAYSHMAAIQYFGVDKQMFHVKAFEDAMNALTAGRADFAVLPLENSSAGMVGDVYDLLVKYDNYIVGELDLPVEHALLGLPEAELSDINVVYSHPQGLMQCSRFLNEQKDWRQVSMENTAVSAKKVLADKDKSQAAIASVMAGELYGLKVLKQPLNFNRNNTTRFIIVTNKKIYIEGAKKISISFEIPHESGSLYNMLSHFIYNNLNMTKIESRPIPGQTWEYRFFVDVEGNLSQSGVKNALKGLSEEAVSIKIFGNY